MCSSDLSTDLVISNLIVVSLLLLFKMFFYHIR